MSGEQELSQVDAVRDALDFRLEHSILVRAAVNAWRFRVWEFWKEGEWVIHDIKDEIEEHVAAIRSVCGDDQLVELVAKDERLKRGSVVPPSFLEAVEDVPRLGAFRLLELVLESTQRELQRASLDPAGEGDWVCVNTPGLWDALSPRDGLLPIDRSIVPDIRRLSDDTFFVVGDRAVFAHPHIRGKRELIRELVWLGCSGYDVRIAVDPHRSVPAEDVETLAFFDYWFGCKVTLTTLDSLERRDLGRAFHTRGPEVAASWLTFPLLGTWFHWSHEGGPIKALEVEEVVPRGTGGSPARDLIINRYLHSRRDTTLSRFIHIDGAVKGFSSGEYGPSELDPTCAPGDAVIYRKLFRVDADEIPLEVWGKLVAHFYRGNELVIEYFGEVMDERPAA